MCAPQAVEASPWRGGCLMKGAGEVIPLHLPWRGNFLKEFLPQVFLPSATNPLPRPDLFLSPPGPQAWPSSVPIVMKGQFKTS